MRNKFKAVWNTDSLDTNVHSVDGIDWLLWFENVPETVGQFEIDQSDTALVGNNLVIENTEISQRGPNVYYKVVPFEYLYTDESTPQVTVKIDDMEALCTTLNCGYVYEAPAGTVDEMTVTGTSVTITGTTMPTDLASITIGNTDCAISGANDATTIACTLASPLYGGSWSPHVKDAKGLVPLVAGFVPHVVTPTVDSISPETGLNPAGGNIITITGTGFPSGVVATSILALTFENGNACEMATSTTTEITCITTGFSPESRRMLTTTFNPVAFIIKFMTDAKLSLEFTKFEFNVTPEAQTKIVTSITPAIASPILYKTLELQLGAGYDTTDFETDTFTVAIIPHLVEDTIDRCQDTKLTGRRALNVVATDATAKTLTVKYGGAYSGEYKLCVSDGEGPLEIQAGVTFTAQIQVSAFSPASGSKYGGSLVTIDGWEFSDLVSDNPVKIGYQVIGGINHYCYVLSTSSAQIKCRMATDFDRGHGESELIVFASTSEEASFADGVYKFFYFTNDDALPSLTGLSTDFDTTTNKYSLTFSGSGFTTKNSPPNTIDTVDVLIGGIA